MKFPVHIPFAEHLGLELVHMAPDQAQLRLAPGPQHLNSFNVVHGGALMALLDIAMAHAARSGLGPDMGAVTVELKTSFMRAATGLLLAEGKVLHRSATLAFVQAEVRDEAGQLCCHATGTFKCVRRLPVGHRQSQALNGPGGD